MDLAYYLDEELMVTLLSSLFSVIPSAGFGLVTYILTALGLYTIAKRRGINHPWLAWIPVADLWILGSLSDQYRYVVKGEIKSKRKSLLTLNIILAAISVLVLVFCGGLLVKVIMEAVNGYMDERALTELMGYAVGVMGLCLPLMGVGIAVTVIRYMALYDLYSSMDPENKVLYIVLSILINVTEPFLVFFLRNKDNGMPPRKEEPAPFIPPQRTEEPWDNNQ